MVGGHVASFCNGQLADIKAARQEALLGKA